MTVFYTKSKGQRKHGKFIYVELSEEQASLLESTVTREPNGHRLDPRLRLHDHGNQYHLTTDGAFELYCAKRKETPLKVYILDTQKQLEKVIEPLGFIL